MNLKDMLPGLFGGRKRKRRAARGRGARVLLQEEEARLVDAEQVARLARRARARPPGILFIDEIDKIAGREGGHGPDVSREGVQRDLLPIVEGTTVTTKYGPVRTDHVLFIAAGAFHVSKPSRPHPRAAGPLPDPRRARAAHRGRPRAHPHRAAERADRAVPGAARPPRASTLEFTDDGDRARWRASPCEVNAPTENIGARRLATILETRARGGLLRGRRRRPARGAHRRRRGARAGSQRLVKDQDL